MQAKARLLQPRFCSTRVGVHSEANAPKVLGGIFAITLMAYVFEIAPGLPPSTGMHFFGSPAARRTAGSLTKATGNADVFPPAGKKFIGIMTSAGPYNFADLDAFTKAVGHQPEVYEFSQGWGVNEFNRGIIERVVRRGMMPRTFTNKPVVVTEVGATDDRGLEAKWVKQMFTELPNQKSLIGIIWFEAVKDVDWRIASDSAAASFFAAGFAERLYQMKWKPSLKLRSEIAR
jgi:hypothetical protein